MAQKDFFKFIDRILLVFFWILLSTLDWSLHIKQVCSSSKSEPCITYLTPCRYLGLQVGYKVMGIVLLMILGWKVHRTEEYSLADDKKDHSDCSAGKQGDPNLLKLCCGVKR